MHVSVGFLLELGVVLVVLSVLGALARRFALSPVPLYLLAGLAVGEGGVAELPEAAEFVETGATIGMVLLLLVLGLEFTISEFSASLRRHLPSAWVDLVLNAAPGALAGWMLGLDASGVLALAGVTYISSSGIVARLLTDLRRLGNRETPAVLSVLVLEDFAMAGFLPLLAVVAAGGDWAQAVLGVVLAVGAVVLALVLSNRWGHQLGRVLTHPDDEPLLLRVLGVTLVVAALAEAVHVSAAVGAFLVGLALSGEAAQRAREVLSPLRDLFAAIFFIAVGFFVEPESLVPLLGPALALAAVSVVTKVASGWYAAGREGAARRGRVRAGTALVAHGEFSLVIVGLVGLSDGRLGAFVAAYVLILAIAGPLLTRYAPGWVRVGGPGGPPGRRVAAVTA
ncbi:CPA2 family monovalent cation:H+ antiporter-2 [Mumia flava]|uniref:CPA2 family monovalent cation:H+ antiporter-2 n=1 Tax=Mumia flava TaxID=1348852 RepID=A0A2M9B6H3_9ACTN|nr:cation:proton antiporter [Mumia flava]PJJ53537.1 CPA2 family monovalent cation:H+ antiporter-2 [Mumia flava]